MWKYLTGRTFGFLITLLLLSLLLMGLVRVAPGDPVQERAGTPERSFADADRQAYGNYLENYRRESAAWFLDVPLFYVSLQPSFYPDTLPQVFPLSHRRALAALCAETQNIQLSLYISEHFMEWAFCPDTAVSYTLKRTALSWLSGGTEAGALPALFSLALQQEKAGSADAVTCRYILAEWERRPDAGLWPRVRWNRQNAFGRWLHGEWGRGGIVRGDWGYTALENRPVGRVIAEHAWSTFILAFWALLLAVPGGTLLGCWMALHHKRRWMRLLRGISLLLYVTPVFVTASFLLLYLATPEGIALFAPYGEAEWDASQGFFSNLWQGFRHLVLPVISLALGLGLFFAAQVRDWLLARFQKEYVRAALSRGIPFRQVLRKHIFPDIRVPFISMIGQAIPEIASGSVLIEYIFARRGLGQLLLEASVHRDLYLLLALVWLSGMLTFAGNTLADVITAKTDKRIVLR